MESICEDLNTNNKTAAGTVQYRTRSYLIMKIVVGVFKVASRGEYIKVSHIQNTI